ncbi:hypothetical protein [Ornithinibacillus caprae]|uniref:hypothetical protein n=1 Tax=Ornithinibacillus caprae TaxID=2678566 RepID=UPI0018C5C725|nr:hypothetical protein [Ornithinibacillus caprae]
MNYESGGVAFVGCIILGVGIGMALDHVAAGSVIGVGVGFLAMAFFGVLGRGNSD